MKEVRSEDFSRALVFLIMQKAVMAARWALVALVVH
jgi:hypothetical protein